MSKGVGKILSKTPNEGVRIALARISNTVSSPGGGNVEIGRLVENGRQRMTILGRFPSLSEQIPKRTARERRLLGSRERTYRGLAT